MSEPKLKLLLNNKQNNMPRKQTRYNNFNQKSYCLTDLLGYQQLHYTQLLNFEEMQEHRYFKGEIGSWNIYHYSSVSLK